MPLVSVLIATFNRKRLLLRAVESVLSQDFDDFELVIFNDCSTDGTEDVIKYLENKDQRIRGILPEQNIGGTHGDREILRQFVYQYSTGKYLIYLCDDDFWIPRNLLSRSVKLLEDNHDIAQVAGGQVQIFDTHIADVTYIDSYWHYEEYRDIAGALLMKTNLPNGLIKKEKFLALQAEDPVQRNILTGASVFRKSAMIEGGVLKNKNGAKWQAGYELTTGIGTQGDTYYFDEASIAAGVDIKSASFRGTQLDHYLDCIRSINIAYKVPIQEAEKKEKISLRKLKNKQIHGVSMNYLLNKIGFKSGFFGTPYLDTKSIFVPPISNLSFLKTHILHGFKFSKRNLLLLMLSGLPLPLFNVAVYIIKLNLGYDWIRILAGRK